LLTVKVNWAAGPEFGLPALWGAFAKLRRGSLALIDFERRMAEGVGNAPTSAMPILFSRQVQPAYICLPSKRVDG
jgi:hypothetical protein